MRGGEIVLTTVSDRQHVFMNCVSILKFMTLITAEEMVLQQNSLLRVNC
jgi:hypothetical protein